MMHVSFSKKIIWILATGLLLACSPWQTSRTQKPHIILITVESLSFESASCEDDSGLEKDGFNELCQSALRFTHFYTQSTLSQSNMATLLTGLDATEHRVVHNGNSAIPVELVTLSEKALQSGYKTAFLSGGPPFLAKSGFQQGYELFNDGFIDENAGYMDSNRLLEEGFQWLESQRQPTLLTLFLADLQFPFIKTYTDEKRERESTTLAQRQEVGEALAHFFTKLKKKKLWNNSYIIVTGLNGESGFDRKSTLWRENLFRENVHVPLFIKPPQAQQKNSVDYLVSMKNLGELLRDLVDQSTASVDFIPQKLEQWSEKPTPYIEVRSDWGAWWFGWAPEVSLRTYDYLIFPKRHMQIFHSLVDKSEAVPLSESQVDKEKVKWIKYRYDESFDKVSTIKNDLFDFLKSLRKAKISGEKDVLKFIDQKKESAFSRRVLADEALHSSDWHLLSEIPTPIYQFVAWKNLQKEEKLTLHEECERLFIDTQRESLLRRCRDHLFLSLLDWEKRRSQPDALVWEKSFMRKFRFYIQYKKIAYLNLYLEMNWDVDVNALLGPSLTELYLHLPDKAALRKKIETYQIPLYAGFP